MKIALNLDGITNKIISINTPTGEGDTIFAEIEDINTFLIELNEKDIYYINGEMLRSDKDPNEFWNEISRMEEESEVAETEIKEIMRQFLHIKDASCEVLIKKLKCEKERKDIKILLLKKEHAKNFAEAKLAESKSLMHKYYCSICLIIRDDNEYLEEWLKHHIEQGVEHFYIYDHSSVIPVSQTLSQLDCQISDKVTLTDFSGSHEFAQHEAYNDCLKKYGCETKWLGFIDSDEFVTVKNGQTMPKVLENFEDHAGFFLVWVMYGASGQKEKNSSNIRERFTIVSPSLESAGVGKVFVQPFLMKKMLTHNGFTLEGFKVLDERKKELEEAATWITDASVETVALNHYYTKSYREWLDKISRGSCDPFYTRKYEEFFMYNPDMEYCREEKFPVQEYEISKKYDN